MGASDSRSFWLSEAAKVQRRINAGWWLERMNRILLILCLLFSAFILWARTEEKSWLDERTVGIAAASSVVLAAVAAWLWSRPRFLELKSALVRLDDRWNLESRLVSAFSGKVSWPAKTDLPLKNPLPEWRGAAAIFPSALSVLIVALAWFVPLPENEPGAPDISTEPRAWEEMDEWVETLQAEEWIEAESLEEIAEQVDELRDQPEEEWFSHSSLEATDTLQESFGRELQDLARDLSALERSLDALRTFSTDLSADGRDMLMREFSEALESLGGNGLSLNEALARQLRELDPSQLGSATMEGLSAEQLDQLRQQLGEGAQTLGSLEGLQPLFGEGEFGFAEGREPFPGVGGIQRGPGDAPMMYGEEDNLATDRIETVSNEDLSRAQVGDVLGLGDTEHDENLEAVGIQEGGGVSSVGIGGEAVWKDALLPEEQAILKRYFD